MCIALISTAHPSYPLILINNRDEYLNRPTAPTHWWQSPHEHVLGGRDLLRAEQGTWLGITKQGRIAVLTNFREENVQLEARSRGAMVNAFLTQPSTSRQSTKDFAESLVANEGLKGVGGFSLVCGRIGEPLAVISNRTPDIEGMTWVAKGGGETIGLSNAAFDDRSWPKVLRGEKLLAAAIKRNVDGMAPRSALVDDLFELLSDDTLPSRKQGEGWDSYVKELRNSIFIPPIGGEGADDLSAEDMAAAKSGLHINVEDANVKESTDDGQSGVYGTQKQTVIIVDHQGTTIFVERSLYDENAKAFSSTDRSRDRRFDFFIQPRS